MNFPLKQIKSFFKELLAFVLVIAVITGSLWIVTSYDNNKEIEILAYQKIANQLVSLELKGIDQAYTKMLIEYLQDGKITNIESRRLIVLYKTETKVNSKKTFKSDKANIIKSF